MVIKLPKEYTVEEIIEAFKKATDFSNLKGEWETKENIVEKQYEHPGIIKPRVIKVYTQLRRYQTEGKRKFLLKKSKKISRSLLIHLEPLSFSKRYEEVNISVILSATDWKEWSDGYHVEDMEIYPYFNDVPPIVKKFYSYLG